MSTFPSKVLVGVDGFLQSQHALDCAVELCAATGSELLIAHVKSLSHYVTGDAPSPAQHSRAEEEGNALLENEAARIAGAGTPISATVLRMGRDVHTELVQVASEVGARLLVLGTSARKPAGRRPRATVSLDIIRDAPCSVWFVREEDRFERRPPPPLRKGTTVYRPHEQGASGNV